MQPLRLVSQVTITLYRPQSEDCLHVFPSAEKPDSCSMLTLTSSKPVNTDMCAEFINVISKTIYNFCVGLYRVLERTICNTISI